MYSIKFYNYDYINDSKIKYVVIVSKYKDKFVLVRHKERKTWEIPGGHIEKNESAISAARRELFEETGALIYKIYPVCTFSVSNETKKEKFSKLFFADIECLDKLPLSEIAEINFFKSLPSNLTYPQIQPVLFRKVIDFLNELKKDS